MREEWNGIPHIRLLLGDAMLESVRRSSSLLLLALMLAPLAAGVGGMGGCKHQDPERTYRQLLSDARHRMDAGDFDAALDTVEQAIDLRPSDLTGHLARGNVLFYAGRYADAVAAYERATDLDPRSAEAEFGAGLAFDRLDRSDEASTRLQRAFELYGERINAAGAGEDIDEDDLISAKLHRSVILSLRGHRELAVAGIEILAAEHPDWRGEGFWMGLVKAERFNPEPFPHPQAKATPPATRVSS